MADYGIIRVTTVPFEPGRWAVVQVTKDGPNGKPVSMHDSLEAAEAALAGLGNADLLDPNPELMDVRSIKWV